VYSPSSRSSRPVACSRSARCAASSGSRPARSRAWRRGALRPSTANACARAAAPSGSRESWRSTARATCSGPNALRLAPTCSVGSTRSATRWARSAPSRNGLPAVAVWHACANAGCAAGSLSRTNASAASGPSGEGRTGASGAAASSSARRLGSAGGSPARTAHRTPSRSSASWPVSCTSQRSDGASARCTSSTTRSVAERSARLQASHVRPCAAACIASPASAGSPASGSSARRARAAAPTARPSHSAPPRTGANNCRAMPQAAWCSSGPPQARRTRISSAAAARAVAARRLDLPMPAGPSTAITRPSCARTSSICRLSVASSASR
jgi:hypothetical protein